MASRREVRLNRETDLLKLVAILVMAVDHVGAILFPGQAVYRIIGRAAFPIFCYCLAAGCCYTRSMGGYSLRLAIAALISQPFYALALGHTNVAMRALTFAQTPVWDALRWYAYSFSACNIMVVLLLGQLLIWTLKEKQYLLTGLLALIVVYLDQMGWITSSYGLRGVLLVLLFWVFIDKPLVSFAWVAGFMLWWGMQGSSYSLWGVRFGIQTFAVFALPLIYVPLERHFRMPKAVFYLFYPLHLAVLFALKMIL